MKINVTWEKKIMGSFELDVTEDILREIENGCCVEDMMLYMDDPEYESDPNNWTYDFAVTDDKGRTIIDWM